MKNKTKNIGHLKRALPDGAEVTEMLPHPMCNSGSIDVWAPDGMVWNVTDGIGCVGVYYEDLPNSRSEAIDHLLADIAAGLRPE
jgi:hypothetical protein